VPGRKDESKFVQNDTGIEITFVGSRGSYDKNGVDRSLIRSNLKRTPTECIQALEELHQLSESARRVDESIR
jgi:hypothetical protein